MSAPVEAVLAEIGKAFRLCRFYPATHPSVQQALSGVSSVLPDLVKVGSIELKITPTGFLLGSAAQAPRNPPVQELANLLYTQGHRFLQMDPGLTVEEIAALIRAASSGAERAMQALGGQAVFEALPHIRLERTSHRAAKKDAPAHAPHAEGPTLGRRTMGVFRPDALPPEIEMSRLATALAGAAGDEGEKTAARMGELIPELVAIHHFGALSKAVAALGHASATADALTSQAASLALDRLTTEALSGLVHRLGDASLPPDERDETARAVASLGTRALGPVADAFLSASDETEREILLAVVRRAGPGAAAMLLSRANPDSRGDAARAQVQLLGATRSPDAVLMLGAFAAHGEPEVRAAAIDALSRIETTEGSRLTMSALRDADALVRAAAARGVAWYGDASAAPVIIGRLEEEEDQDTAIALIDCLGELRNPVAVPVLTELTDAVRGVFQRHATPVRVAAIRALGAIGTDAARDAIKERLRSRRDDVRAAAALALGA